MLSKVLVTFPTRDLTLFKKMSRVMNDGV
jgi:hypothetical protein